MMKCYVWLLLAAMVVQCTSATASTVGFDTLGEINDFLQNIGDPSLDGSKLPVAGHFMNKHKRQADYVNLLEMGGREKLMAMAAGDRERELAVRESISSVDRTMQLVSAVAITVGDHTFIKVEAGLSLVSLGGGVAVSFGLQVKAIPKLAAVVENYLAMYYEENEEGSTVLRFMHQLDRRLKEIKGCENMLEQLLKSKVTFGVGIDVSITRAVYSVGTLTVLPTFSFGLSRPFRLYLEAPQCVSGLGIQGLRYFGARNPKYNEQAEAGVKVLTGMQETFGNAGKISDAVGKFFETDKAEFSMGSSISLGKGALGVGFGLEVACTQKAGVNESVYESCFNSATAVLNKLYRMYRQSNKKARRRLLAEEASPVEKVKHLSAVATATYHSLSAQVAAAPAANTALIETLTKEMQQQKFVIITSLLIAGIVSSIMPVVLVASDEQKEQSGMKGTLAIEGVDDIAEVTAGGFLGRDKCTSGISGTMDFADASVTTGFETGPITACAEDICKNVLGKLGYDAKKASKTCTGYRSLAGNLLSMTPAKAIEYEHTLNEEEVYRWKTQPSEGHFVDAKWSVETTVKWGEETPLFPIENRVGSIYHHHCIQFRVPRDHQVSVQIVAHNDDLKFLRGIWASDMNIEPTAGKLPIMHGLREYTWKGEKKKKDFYSKVWNMNSDKETGVGPVFHFGAGTPFPLPCGATDNFVMCYTNFNDWFDAEVSYKFEKKRTRECKVGRYASEINVGERVKKSQVIYGGVQKDRETFMANLENVVKGKMDDTTSYLLNPAFEVVEKPGAGADDKCCSGYCDGSYCTEQEGFSGVRGDTCQKSREDFRNQWTFLKLKKTKCYMSRVEKNTAKLKAAAVLQSNKDMKSFGDVVKKATARLRLEKLRQYKEIDGKTVLCGDDEIEKMDTAIEKAAKNMMDESKTGCGERWAAFNANPKIGFDVDLTKGRYKLALLASGEDQGKLGLCTGKGDGSLVVEEMCDCKSCIWKEVHVSAKRGMIERINVDNGIQAPWVDISARARVPDSETTTVLRL